ncbi:unnamed protein product [Choristocarpus tenellus]
MLWTSMLKVLAFTATVMVMGTMLWPWATNDQAGLSSTEIQVISQIKVSALQSRQNHLEVAMKKLLDLQELVMTTREHLHEVVPPELMPGLQNTAGNALHRAQSFSKEVEIEKVLSASDYLCLELDQVSAVLVALGGATESELPRLIDLLRLIMASVRTLDPTQHLPYLPVNGPGSVAKVLLYFSQLVALMPIVNMVKFPGNFIFFLEWLDIANFSVAKMMDLGCVVGGDFHNELVFKTVAPLLLLVLVWCPYATSLLRPCSKNETSFTHSLEDISKRCLSASLVLTYLVLGPVCSVIFRSFYCEEFDDGRNLLLADYSVDCDSVEHRKYFWLALVMTLVYPIGIPALYTALLMSKRRLLYPSHVWARPKEDVRLVVEARDINHLALWMLSPVFAAYQPQVWWFEIFESGRRIVLTGVLVGFIPGETYWRIHAALVVTLLSLTVHAVFSPFIDWMDNALYTTTQILTLIMLFVGLILDAEEISGVAVDALDWMLLVLSCGALAAGQVLMAMKKHSRRSNLSKEGVADVLGVFLKVHLLMKRAFKSTRLFRTTAARRVYISEDVARVEAPDKSGLTSAGYDKSDMEKEATEEDPLKSQGTFHFVTKKGHAGL